MGAGGNLSTRDRLLNLEKDLQAIAKAFAEHQKWMLERAKGDDEFREEMRFALGGGGADPGIRTRLDRLEQSEARRMRWNWVVFAAAIGALFTALASLLMHGAAT